MTARWQHAVSKSGTLLLSQEGSSLEVGGQGSPCNHHSVPDLSWQTPSPVRNTLILQCFDAVGWVTGRNMTCKSSATTVPKCFVSGRSNTTLSDSGEMGQMNKNKVRVSTQLTATKDQGYWMSKISRNCHISSIQCLLMCGSASSTGAGRKLGLSHC